MNDKQRYELLQKFLNDSSIAKGGNIRVDITAHTCSMSCRDFSRCMKYEDTKYLDELKTGGEALLYYLAREGYFIQKKKIDKKRKV